MERIIEIPNPQPEVRRNAERANDWEFKNEASYLYRKAIALRERLIDPVARIDKRQLPDPIIGFENLRNYKVLAEYLIVRDADDRKIDWFRLGKEVRGRSSLSKWVCPECNLKVRIGIKGNPELVHEPCSEKKGKKVFFVKADGLR